MLLKSRYKPPILRARNRIPSEVLKRKGIKLFGYQAAIIKEQRIYRNANAADLAKQFKIDKSMVGHIVSGRCWADIEV